MQGSKSNSAKTPSDKVLPVKWLIYGHRGWIGCQVVELLSKDPSNILCLPETRIDNVEEIKKDLDCFQPDRVISLTGRTHGPGYGTIDYLEQKGKLTENIRDNLYGPIVLATICRERNIHYTYLGTGCIFTYDEEHPMDFEQMSIDQDRTKMLFDETALPNYFDSSYSAVKGFTDRLMHLYDDSCLNIRIRMPITSHDNPRNFISKIIRYQKVISIPNSMTVLDELLPAMLRLSQERVTGTVNLCNPGVISHNEILDLYREYVDPKFTYQNFSAEELLKVTACGRSNNALSTEKLETLVSRYDLKVSPIKEAVVEALKCWH